MAKVKDFCVLCLDVGPSMVDPDNGTPLKTSIKIINQIIQQKMFTESKDEVALVLFGTSGTDNSLADTEGGYENITVARPMGVCDLDFLHYIHNSIQPGDTPADFIDALVVSMDLINQAINNAPKVGEKRIYLFTNAESDFNPDQLDQICDGVNSMDIHLTIVGPSLDDDDDTGGTPPDSLPESRPGTSHRDDTHSRRRRKRTKQQMQSEEMMTKILEKVEGDSYSFSEALKLVSFLHQKEKKQTTRFTGCLEIGTTMKIGCKMFTKVMTERPMTWKKMSAISLASRNPDKMSVTMVRSYHQQDEDETEVEADSITKGFRYGKSLIPISSADEEAMKLKAEKCLSVLGFTKMDKIKHHHYLGSSILIVVATPGDQCAEQAMSALINALFETNMVAIVRYVWRNNGNPKLALLSPCIKKDYECLMLTVLPFMEDIRHFAFTPLDKVELTQDQDDAVDNIITSMDLMAYEDEDGNRQEALKPKMLFNPLILRTFQCIQHRALNPGTTLPKLDPLIDNYLRPNEAIVANCTDQIQRLKDLFPLVKVEEKKTKTTAADVWKTGPELDLDAERPAKRPRTEDGEQTDFSMASLAKGEITEVGTVDPVSDYQTLLGNKLVDNYEDASRQLQAVIMKLVKESFGDVYYDKALECVRVLREEAIKHEEADMFNDFLRKMKDDFLGTRYSAFWDKVAQEGISLITSSECSDNGVSDAESKSFIESQAPVAAVVEDEPDEVDDADDLLAMM
ncbi:X-ray repair cross-complementing protein 5-like [Dysidea avara]|uniref:X-ray repair cross-complementing protein 5-like n=1 Tax=Dysidea avara TaxID=196820 RepID=UPI0033264118